MTTDRKELLKPPAPLAVTRARHAERFIMGELYAQDYVRVDGDRARVVLEDGEVIDLGGRHGA